MKLLVWIGVSMGAALSLAASSPGHSQSEIAPAIDYDQAVSLDSEDLAEQGMKEAYDRLAPSLVALGVSPEPISEAVDSVAPTYKVTFRGQTVDLWQTPSEGLSWCRAGRVFFEIVNAQLKPGLRFYALNNGNDLHGIFLTDADYARAMTEIDKKTDRPFIPTEEPEWCGQPHD